MIQDKKKFSSLPIFYFLSSPTSHLIACLQTFTASNYFENVSELLIYGFMLNSTLIYSAAAFILKTFL